MDITCTGIAPADLARILTSGTDDGGNAVEPFVDEAGGWPLRCCLHDSRPGDRVAIIAHSPFAWHSPYRETGPIVVHTEGCPGTDGSFPEELEGRDQVVRAFGRDAGRTRTQVYDRNRLVRAGDGLRAAVEDVLADDRVDVVHVHNVVSQCYNFRAAATR